MSETIGLSILIPVYNIDVRTLVTQLTSQGNSIGFPVEIRCYDDQSERYFSELNQEVNFLPNTIYKVLDKNIGRASIRNLLANEAKYKYLLFIDADSRIVSENYLINYWENIKENKIIVGGTVYHQSFDPKYSLRLIYGKQREECLAVQRRKNPYQYITLNNIIIEKNVFLKYPLDESLKTYGHEDTKFGYTIKLQNIPINHIDNPVEHTGLETNDVFLQKSIEGIKNFYRISLEGYGHESKLYRTHLIIKKYKLEGLFNAFYSIRKKQIEKNLLSENPSIFNFDLLKLRLFIQEDKFRK